LKDIYNMSFIHGTPTTRLGLNDVLTRGELLCPLRSLNLRT
jgi:hypothetical protein